MIHCLLAALALAQAGIVDPGSLDQALAEARASLARAHSAEASRDDEGARLEVRAGLAALEGWDEQRQAEALNFLLAGIARRNGDRQAAREGWERSRAWREQHLAAEDPLLQEIRTNVAVLMKEEGDLQGALVLEEQVLEVCECTLPENHAFRMAARNNLALTLWGLGDYVAARTLLERELAARERWLGPEDPRTLTVLGNLAIVLSDMGDLSASRIVSERVIDSLQRVLARTNLAGLSEPASSDGMERSRIERLLAISRLQLAIVAGRTGNSLAGLEQAEFALSWFEAHGSPDEIDFIQARIAVASFSSSLADRERARTLFEQAAEEAGKVQRPGSAGLLMIEGISIESLLTTGDCAEALRRARELRLLTLRGVHAEGFWGRRTSTLWLRAALCSGEPELAASIADVVAWTERDLRRGLLCSSREASEIVMLTHSIIALLLDAQGLLPEDRSLRRTIFELVESARDLSVRSRALALEPDPELSLLSQAVSQARERVQELVASMDASESEAAPTSGDLAAAVLARDRAEERLVRRLSPSSSGRMVDLEVLASSIGPEEACAAYWAGDVPIGARSSSTGRQEKVVSLLAHIVRPGGELVRVDLGPLIEIEAAVLRWREAIGQPLGPRASSPSSVASAGTPDRGERGESVFGRGARDDTIGEVAAGEALRRLALDPVRAAAGPVQTLRVCADDLLSLVPLDALPDGTGVVGDRLRIVLQTSLSRRSPRPARESPPVLVAFGGLDFGAPRASAVEPPGSPARVEGATLRMGLRGDFPYLPASAREARAVGELFEEAFDRPGLVVSGREGSKSRLMELAPRASFLHLATHGYSASEELLALSADWSSGTRSLSPQSAALGLAPMALCGLALAGANAGAGATGRMDGVITAEELSGLDLSGCELAVLSACDTNVHAGVRRLGLGVQSLRAAVHAAGVRSSISTLWSIDDEAARELALSFYRGVWVDRLPKVEALWTAKAILRAKGYPVRDWAAWVLTGDPD